MAEDRHTVEGGSRGPQTDDPWRSLEEDSAATVTWQARQDALAERALHDWGPYGELDALLAGLPAGRFETTPKHRGSRWFFTAVPSGGDRRLLYSGVAPDMTDAAVVVDPAGADETLWDYWPSPDGCFVACAMLAGAAEGGELRVVDVETGQAACPPSLFSTWTRLAWTPDSCGFYFNGVSLDDGKVGGVLWHQRIGEDGPVAQAVEFEGLACYADVSRDGGHVVASVGLNELRPSYRLDLDSGEWHTFLPDVDTHLHGTVVNNEYVAVTTGGADRGRVVAIPLDAPHDTERWRELVPESDASIRALSLVGERLVLSELIGGCSRLRVRHLDGPDERIIETPGLGMVTTSGQAAPMIGVPMVDTSTGCDEITFLFSSPARPHAPYRYDLDADRLHAIPGNNAHDPAATTTMLRATSRDGTEVPCFLTHLATVDRDRPQPTLILAYGAWNLPNSPRYTLAAAAFVLSGGIVAHPILRGGGEHGSRWWHEGRRHNKQNTFDDLFAVAEHLITASVTVPRLLGLQGGSAGGLTAGAAVTQRPDLFGAVVITAPLLDLLRAEPTRNIPSETTKSELGDPSDPADAAVLAGYSPYQHLSAADYPPILVVAAEHDVRTPPWHSRKFVARLQSVTTSTNPALLRILKAMGHGTGATPASERTTEWLGFIMKHLGVRPGDGNVSPSGHRPSLQP